MIRQLALLLALTVSCSSCRCLDVPPGEETLTVVTTCEGNPHLEPRQAGVLRDGDFVIYSNRTGTQLGDGVDEYTSCTFEVCVDALQVVREQRRELLSAVLELDLEVMGESNGTIDVITKRGIKSELAKKLLHDEGGRTHFDLSKLESITILEGAIARYAALLVAYGDDARVRRATLRLVYGKAGTVASKPISTKP